MEYCIVGSNRYRMRSNQVRRLCRKLQVSLLDLLIATEDDRHPMHIITVWSNHAILTKQVKDVFGRNFELRRNKNE